MEVLPAIDIMGQRCVQLVGGDPNTKVDYGEPVERALMWVRQGARQLHVVDLDAALELGSNLNILGKIKSDTKAQVQFGGGVRSEEDIVEVLRLDVDRVVVGTLAVRDYLEGFKCLSRIREGFGEKVVVAVDSRAGYVTVKGWQKKTSLTVQELINASQDIVWGFLHTNVDVEGKMGGVDSSVVEEVVSSTDKPVIISGGVTSIKDLDLCEKAGAWGVVLGKALYEGRIGLVDVI